MNKSRPTRTGSHKIADVIDVPQHEFDTVFEYTLLTPDAVANEHHNFSQKSRQNSNVPIMCFVHLHTAIMCFVHLHTGLARRSKPRTRACACLGYR